MYNSIAPVELTTQMRRQFADAVDRHVPESHPVRRWVSGTLRALANRLEPLPAAR